MDRPQKCWGDFLKLEEDASWFEGSRLHRSLLKITGAPFHPLVGVGLICLDPRAFFFLGRGGGVTLGTSWRDAWNARLMESFLIRLSCRIWLNCTFFTIPYNPNIVPTGYCSWISPSTTRWQDSCWMIFLCNGFRFYGCLEPAYISTPD